MSALNQPGVKPDQGNSLSKSPNQEVQANTPAKPEVKPNDEYNPLEFSGDPYATYQADPQNTSQGAAAMANSVKAGQEKAKADSELNRIKNLALGANDDATGTDAAVAANLAAGPGGYKGPAIEPAAPTAPAATDFSLGKPAKGALNSPGGQAAGAPAAAPNQEKSLLDRLGYRRDAAGKPAPQQGGFDYTPTESIQRKHYAVTESDLPYLKAALRGRLTSIVNEKMVLGKSSDASSSGSFLQGESKTKKRK